MIKKLVIISTILIASIGGYFGVKSDNLGGGEMLGANFPDSQWTVINSFQGFVTKADPAKIPNGANPNGQNTETFDGDRFGIREIGYEIFPNDITASSTASPITSLHTFRKRDGTNILMRSYGTVLEYYSTSTGWTTLSSGYTSGQEFGFADFNINTDLKSYVYFGNGVDAFSRWDGESATTTTFDDNPRGNIYFAQDNRLFIAGIPSTTQAIYFSRYAAAEDFGFAATVIDGTDDDPGIFNLGEGGGAVKGMVADENSMYFLKKSIIYKANVTDAVYSISALKPFDGKSQTIGLVSKNGVFTGGNQVYFVTPDNQIMSLERVENVDFPQNVSISDAIKPTVDAMNFDEMSGIVFRDRAYFSAKSNKEVANNDTILVWDIRNKKWLSPIVGFNARCFAVYDDGNGEELYFGSSVSPNVYKVTDTAIDDIYEVTANWRSKRFDFGAPHLLKDMTDLYIEGYISDNTTLTVSLLLDENGSSQQYSTQILGTDTNILFSAPSYNTFGLTPFGSERFGSNDDQAGKKPFRIYLTEMRATPFYNAQLDFASDGSGQAWEVTAIGMATRINSQQQKRSLFHAFK